MRQKNVKLNRPVSVAGPLQNVTPKTMAMVVLLTVMGILWGRVLLKGKGGPASAKAQTTEVQQQIAVPVPVSSEVVIEPINIPILEGRNDVLTRDPFSTLNWSAYDLNSNSVSVPVEVIDNGDETALKRIESRLILEGIACDELGHPLQAYVDNKILTVGMSLTVQEGPDQYVLTLSELNEKKAVFKWHDISVVLKMTESFEF